MWREEEMRKGWWGGGGGASGPRSHLIYSFVQSLGLSHLIGPPAARTREPSLTRLDRTAVKDNTLWRRL